MPRKPLINSVLAFSSVLAIAAAAAEMEPSGSKALLTKQQKQQIERGRYLVKIAGCNDCHTPGYAQTGGKVPESQWLTGDKLGWRGPWGTTYPANLRLYMAGLTATQWVQRAKTMQTRPPMPWFALRDMTEQDLKAVYRFVKALGPAGEPAPVYVSQDRQPQTPFVQFPAPPQ